MGERELRTAPLTTNEESSRVWQVIQNERRNRQSTTVEQQRRFAMPDNTPPVEPSSHVVSGQWEPGRMLYACHMTEEGRTCLGMRENQFITVIDPEEEGGSAGGVAGSQAHDEGNNELSSGGFGEYGSEKNWRKIVLEIWE